MMLLRCLPPDAAATLAFLFAVGAARLGTGPVW